ncbi:hypothetical protein PAN31108_04811 [Pandoraea anhela]|uniref:Uncharacterized protein n=1 Tax=Pandoraea anhela TaxID=2508295 RepID=A0A5E4YWC2_9BURK|nr:hypothetical protein PAN31108_04811 [Pandoraea anhela]
MLCARVVRGAASSAKPTTPAAAMRALFSASNGLSMPTTTAPRCIRAISATDGARTFSTISAPNASAAVPLDAPAATYAASGTLAAAPAPCSTVTRCPALTSFFTVSGVAATRDSPSAVSFGMPICIVIVSGSEPLSCCETQAAAALGACIERPSLAASKQRTLVQ